MPDLLTASSYGVDEKDSVVQLHIGKATLPMTWDVAMRMAARMRVAVRGAQEFIGKSRELETPQHEQQASGRRVTAVHQMDILAEGEYKVYTDGPDVVLEAGGGVLRMEPEVGRNISIWLATSGTKVKEKYAPDLELRFHVAQLTDANLTEMARQGRQDGTAAFSTPVQSRPSPAG